MNSEHLKTVIAIDGPAASGKSTIGRMLADHLGYLFLDTGCMYRAATLAALRTKIDVSDEESVVSLTESLEMDIRPPSDEADGRLYTVILEGKDVTWDIRDSDVDINVSQVSAYKGVRTNLVRRQREFASRGKVVVVGRDIGTVVLPNAPLKLYIVASTTERAKRRWQEQKERGNFISYEQVLADIDRRDRFDGRRQHSPMRQADDAIVVDTTGRMPDEVLSGILSLGFFQGNSNLARAK